MPASRSSLLHPADSLRHLDLSVGPDRIGIVESRDLHVDLAGEDDVVGIEERGSALGAEVAPPILRRGIFPGLAFDLELVLARPAPRRPPGRRYAGGNRCNGTAPCESSRPAFHSARRRNGIDPSACFDLLLFSLAICHNGSAMASPKVAVSLPQPTCKPCPNPPCPTPEPAYLRRPQPAAARGGADHRRPGAGAGRRRAPARPRR